LNDLYRSNRTAAQDCAHTTIANGGDSKDREFQALNAQECDFLLEAHDSGRNMGSIGSPVGQF
jgi:hypothetical protein